MNSIFWKIFVSFWVVMVLVAGATLHVSFYLASERAAQVDELSRIDIIRDAETALVNGGAEGFGNWLRRDVKLPPAQTLFLIDRDGNDVLGRRLPTDARLAFRHLKRSGRLQRSTRVPRVAGPDGKTYIALFGPTRPPAFGVLSTPGVHRVVLLIALIISALACYALTRYLTTPLRQVSRAARELAAGRLSARAGDHVYRHDELGQLARQFDDMAGALERQLTTRRDLLRNVSHELRSPLARMQVALELARRQPDQLEAQLARIDTEVGHMEHLTAQMLSLARLQADDSPAPEDFDLRDLVQRAADDAAFEGSPENKTVSVVLTDDPATVHGHSELLHSAIENVVRNALRFTADGTAITLELTIDGNETVLHVRDSGPGVAEHLLPHIFEPFFQGQVQSGGTGVGLALTAQIVRIHDGRIRASNREAGGLDVEIRLPLKVVNAAA